MIDYSKLVTDAKKIIRSHTAKDLQDWINSYNERIALAEQEDSILQPAVIKPRMSTAKLNGAPQSAAKAKGATIKKISAKAPQPRSSDGKFANAKKTTRRTAAFA